jgi:peptidyl-prolyl cis-trans isomerase C
VRSRTFFFLFALCAVLSSGAPRRQGKNTLIRCGDETVTAEEVRYLLARQAGGNEGIASVILNQMSETDTALFLGQIAESMLLAKAAQLQGLHLEPRVAAQIRWNDINLLAQAYVGWASERWDMSEDALRRFYESHGELFFQEEEVHVRQILFKNGRRGQERSSRLNGRSPFDMLAEQRSIDPVSSRNGGDMGWVRRRALPKPVEDAIFQLSPGTVRSRCDRNTAFTCFRLWSGRNAVASGSTSAAMRSGKRSAVPTCRKILND